MFGFSLPTTLQHLLSPSLFNIFCPPHPSYIDIHTSRRMKRADDSYPYDSASYPTISTCSSIYLCSTSSSIGRSNERGPVYAAATHQTNPHLCRTRPKLSHTVYPSMKYSTNIGKRHKGENSVVWSLSICLPTSMGTLLRVRYSAGIGRARFARCPGPPSWRSIHRKWAAVTLSPPTRPRRQAPHQAPRLYPRSTH